MNLFYYLSAYDSKRPEVEIVCPGCSTPRLMNREDFDQRTWVVQCARCEAIYGVASDTLFSLYVKIGQWSTSKPSAPPQYCDLIIRRMVGGAEMLSRWHGWVDRETRKIVQEG